MVMEAQEVEAVCASFEVDDPGLVGMQPQPEPSQDRRRPPPGLFGPLAWCAQTIT